MELGTELNGREDFEGKTEEKKKRIKIAWNYSDSVTVRMVSSTVSVRRVSFCCDGVHVA